MSAEYSLIASGTGNNNFCNVSGGRETEFVSKYKPRVFGKMNVVLKYFNRIYSTGCGTREQAGEPFLITGAAVGFADAKAKRAEFEVPVTFNSRHSVLVDEGFTSDEISIDIPEGMWLFVRFTVYSEKDIALLSTDESASGGYRDGLRTLNVLRPNLILCDRSFDKTLVFLGDSITQGTRTAADKYEAWAHRVAFSLPTDINVLNLGMGWSRAYDAAADTLFLRLAKSADELTVCFGVNDIKSGKRTAAQVCADLKRIIELIKGNNPHTRIILFTVPPFNLEPWEEEQRRKVNAEILSGAFDGEVFDFAEILEQADAPGRVLPEFMADKSDAHPNGKAGEAIARRIKECGLFDGM